MCESEFKEKASLKTATHQGRKPAGLINRETMSREREPNAGKAHWTGRCQPLGWGSAPSCRGNLQTATPALRRQLDQMSSRHPYQLKLFSEQTGEVRPRQQVPNGQIFFPPTPLLRPGALGNSVLLQRFSKLNFFHCLQHFTLYIHHMNVLVSPTTDS